MADVLLEMQDIEKVFPGGVRALDKVNISVRAGGRSTRSSVRTVRGNPRS